MRAGRTITSPFLFLAAVTLFSGCAPVEQESSESTEELGTTAEELTANAPPLPVELRNVAHLRRFPSELLRRPFSIDHFVPIGNGRRIHVTETLTLASILRYPRRAALLLPGPLTTGAFLNIQVDGYRGGDRLASRGFFALSADFEGTGRSSSPPDGRDATLESQVAAMKRVLEYFRIIRLVSKVDVLGESWGGGVAAELCADNRRVRSCTLASILYKTPSDFANATFRSPEFRELLDSFPDGYFPTTADFYYQLVGQSPPEVQEWTFANMPGRYTTAPLYDAFDLPSFDPSVARVPGLIIQGQLDPNQDLADTQELANDYDDGGADIVVVPGAGHIPRVEPPPNNEIFWTAVEQFMDP